ncbi:alpha/beta hydrolase [Agrobacterium sp. OT33]|uniref:alpha/beta hydrolase n=1 Tax=Agrobacterium sp. OT33 TaxID=2815338 RepID=UPI001A906B68|nr:alpha/beta hydrolase [Agrobacterium sp. OT33]
MPTVKTAISPDTKIVEVLSATNRTRMPGETEAFTAMRATQTSYNRLEVSLPPNHRAGEIEWPQSKPDPRRSFAIVDQQALSEDAFFKKISSSSRGSELGLFIHGYNVSYQESIYRLAQMTADSGAEGTAVLFGWPSRSSVSAYGVDKEAVTSSRDQLAALLVGVTASRKSGEVRVLAHSMGCWLLMEALRQLKLEKRGDVLKRLDVYLASPDIDEDVFRTQLAVVGKMQNPLTIFVSKDDTALTVSGLLTGDTPRLGALDVSDPVVIQAAREKGVRVIDISSIKAPDQFRHGRYAALAVSAAALGKDGKPQRPTLGEAGAYIFDAAGAAVSSPFRLASQIINP